MTLVNSKKMLDTASKNKYAVGAFNFTNMEQLQAITETAEKLNSPVILGVSTSAFKYMNPALLVGMVKGAVSKLKQPICLHLDHGKTYLDCKKAIDSGFTSVMIDASYLDYKENIALTKKVVAYAKPLNVTVEAELGKLAGVEDDVASEFSSYTKPEQALDFVNKTGVDSLAISIGTSHGAYKFEGEPTLRIDILKATKKLLPNTPIVLHGASSISKELITDFKKSGGKIKGAKGVNTELLITAIKNGIAKVNVDSDLRIAFSTGIRETLKNKKEFNPRNYLLPAKEKMKKQLEYKILNIFNSAYKNKKA